MIQYDINNDTKTITCILSGEELRDSLIRLLNKRLKSYHINNLQFQPHNFVLSDKYIGIAKYHPNEEAPFSEEVGKHIAKKKAFLKYNKDVLKKIRLLKQDVTSFGEDLLMECFQYEYIISDVKNHLKKY